jgi:hypothetical protein
MSEHTMKPTIEAAKQTAIRMNARQVVVAAFDYNGRMAVVSYGVTKTECQDVRRLCDAIADGLMDGTLPAPEANR